METNAFTLLDGAMGTMLQRAGLELGARPETLCLTAPEVVADIHRQYIAAGSQIVYANTFGANRHKLAGTGHSVREVVAAAVDVARTAAAGQAKVALDIGPTGELLAPLGTLDFEEAVSLFREMAEAGSQADLVVIETMADLYEAKAALLAVKEVLDVPVIVTMTFEGNGRTFTGCSVPAMAVTLEALGASAIGFNCSLGPRELYPLMEELREWTSLPLAIKANAGLPDPETGAYTIGPADFAQTLAPFVDLGVTLFGGCCGTDPQFIRAVAAMLADKQPVPRQGIPRRGLCGPGQVVELGGVRVIGERLNPTGKKRLQQALREGDSRYLAAQALAQADAGADILDLNVGLPGLDEAAAMAAAVDAVQTVCPLPLQIDTTDPAAAGAGLRRCNGRPILNSVNGRPEVLAALLPIAKRYGAAVVGLTVDGSGIPANAEGRLAIARRIRDAARAQGIPDGSLFIDPLVMTAAAEQAQARETLRAVALIRRELGLSCVLGVSNISHGLPRRREAARVFLAQALALGLDLPILDPTAPELMDTICAHRLLTGEDPGGAAYIARFANTAPAPLPAVDAGGEMPLDQAVWRGLKEQAAAAVRAAIEGGAPPAEVIDTLLIPALDAVGDAFERQELFLPQMMASAAAACEGFEVVRAHLAGQGQDAPSRGKIVLATVKGDIHDIGKNIVRVMLENYGYTVTDLGRDVDPAQVVEAVRREGAPLVGLSALMTTTVPSMAATIDALRAAKLPCRIMVGGAVLTADYAARIGADHYAKDAKGSVDIARQVFGA